MKSFIAIILILISLPALCACQRAASVTTTPTTIAETAKPTSAPETAAPSTAPETTDVPSLSELSDYELLRNMASSGAMSNWATCSYRNPDDPLSVGKRFSEDFAELLNRDSAADSIRRYMYELNDEFPGSFMIILEMYLPDIEAYIAQNH